VIGHGGQVAADGAKAIALLGGQLQVAGLLREHQQPGQAHQALAGPGVQVAVEADALDQ
jgi:hypothetical protein